MIFHKVLSEQYQILRISTPMFILHLKDLDTLDRCSAILHDGIMVSRWLSVCPYVFRPSVCRCRTSVRPHTRIGIYGAADYGQFNCI